MQPRRFETASNYFLAFLIWVVPSLVTFVGLTLLLAGCKPSTPPASTLRESSEATSACGPKPTNGCDLAYRGCVSAIESKKNLQCAKDAAIEAFPGLKNVNENVELVQAAIELVRIFENESFDEVLKYFGGESNAKVSSEAADKLSNLQNGLADKAEEKGEEIADEAVKKLGFERVR